MSKLYCCVTNCTSKSTKSEPHSELTFYPFPPIGREKVPFETKTGVEFIDRFKAWELRIKRDKISPHHKVCCLHFTSKDFYISDGCDKKRLKRTAVPSIFLPKSSQKADNSQDPEDQSFEMVFIMDEDLDNEVDEEITENQTDNVEAVQEADVLPKMAKTTPSILKTAIITTDDKCSIVHCNLAKLCTYRTTYYSAPKDEAMKKKWIQIIGQHNLKGMTIDRICSFHFRSTCFERIGNETKLKADSMPSINLPTNVQPPRVLLVPTTIVPPGPGASATTPTIAVKQPVAVQNLGQKIVLKKTTVAGPSIDLTADPPPLQAITLPVTPKPTIVVTPTNNLMQVQKIPASKIVHTNPAAETLQIRLDFANQQLTTVRRDYEKKLTEVRRINTGLAKKMRLQEKLVNQLKERLKKKDDPQIVPMVPKKVEEKVMFIMRNNRMVRLDFNSARQCKEPAKKVITQAETKRPRRSALRSAEKIKKYAEAEENSNSEASDGSEEPETFKEELMDFEIVNATGDPDFLAEDGGASDEEEEEEEEEDAED